jgi:membrane protein
MAAGKPSRQERGREADDPSEIPAAGWKDIVSRVWKSFADDRMRVIAGGISFYGILSLVPQSPLSLLYMDISQIRRSLAFQLNAFSHVLPEGALNAIGDEIKQAAGRGRQGLVELLGSFTVAIWSANVGVRSTLDALNIVYAEKKAEADQAKRRFTRVYVEVIAIDQPAMTAARVGAACQFGELHRTGHS